MNAYNGYTNQYATNNITQASPEQLMLMLYDGAVRFLAQAIKAVEDNDRGQRSHFINKSSAIISEFAATLDHTQNPELAEQLDALYAYMLKQLMLANAQNDAAPMREVKGLLSDLRKTWAQAIAIAQEEKQSAAQAQGIASADQNTYKPLSAAL